MNAERSTYRAQRAYWVCQFAGWGLYGTGTYFSLALIGQLSWLRATAATAVVLAIGIALSHLLRLLIRQRGWRAMRVSRRVPRLVGASLILGLFTELLQSSLGLAKWQCDPLPIGPPAWQPLLPFSIDALSLATVFLLWSAFYFGVLAFRDHKSRELREAELARALQASELRLLKSQLNPHFLFNALNAVRALIADEPQRAQSAVTQLARTLRYTLGSGQGELVTLAQELATVEDYLALETLRLGERLRVDFSVDSQARELRIPVMLLQTLVENAIKHGIAELPAGGVLRICAWTAGGALLLEVENPRPEPRAQPTPQGIGIANAQKRLHLLFGPEAALHLDLSHPARALARVSLPLPP
jgi:two-component system sensor histidine kinase AlgZ